MNTFLGIDVGATTIKANLLKRDGTIIYDTRIGVESSFTNLEFLKALEHITEECTRMEKPAAIGIGTPGPIDIEEGVILGSANLPNLKNVPVVSHLNNFSKLPVFFNNDANCAALGEYHFGNSSHSQNLVVFTLGTGLGCGWIQNGKLFNGYKGSGMEAGHMTVVPDGALCGCGQKGCIEAYFSTRGLTGRYYDRTLKSVENAAGFFNLVEKGDRDAREVLNFAVQMFANAIRSVVHLVNPDKIVFLGGITASYSSFGPELEARVKEIIFPVFRDYLKFEVGQNLAGTLGAASLAF